MAAVFNNKVAYRRHLNSETGHFHYLQSATTARHVTAGVVVGSGATSQLGVHCFNVKTLVKLERMFFYPKYDSVVFCSRKLAVLNIGTIDKLLFKNCACISKDIVVNSARFCEEKLY